MRVWVGTLAGAIAVTVVAAACGGESERLTAEQYDAAAAGICTELNERLDALESPEGEEERADALEEAIGHAEDALERLRQLRPPEVDAGAVNDAYDVLEEELELGADLADAIRDGDAERAEELSGRFDELGDRFAESAGSYDGLVACRTG